jgi:S1-C subfamily serine protease
VVVTRVEAGSLAARGGLQGGDLIVGINGHTIKTTADFAEAVKEVDVAKGVRLAVKRDGVQHFVFLRSGR